MKKTMPVKTKRIELEGEYEGWWYEFRTNPPSYSLIDAIGAFEAANKDSLTEILPPVYALIGLIIHAWNFVDEKGRDLPANKDGLKKLPIDLVMLIAEKSQEAILAAPLANELKTRR